MLRVTNLMRAGQIVQLFQLPQHPCSLECPLEWSVQCSVKFSFELSSQVVPLNRLRRVLYAPAAVDDVKLINAMNVIAIRARIYWV